MGLELQEYPTWELENVVDLNRDIYSTYPALSFDGVDDYVDMGNHSEFNLSDGTNDLPCTIIANITPVDNERSEIMSKIDGSISDWEWVFGILDNELRFRLYSGGGGDTLEKRVNLPYLNKMMSVGVTYNGSATLDGIKFYVDGNEITDVSYTQDNDYTTVERNNCSVRIGVFDYNGEYETWGQGIQNNTSFWNYEMTQTEIQDNMNKELTGNEDGLVAYYKMNEGEGSTAYDSAGDNDGTIYGAEWLVGGELFFNDLFGHEALDKYNKTGQRVSKVYDFFNIPYLEEVNYVESQINWSSDTPTNTDINIYIKIDDGDFIKVTNGGSFPIWSVDDNIKDSTFQIKQEFTTTDIDISPSLSSVDFNIITSEDKEFKMYTLKDGSLYVNGEIKGNYSTDFIEINNNEVILKGENIFDELLIKDVS